MSAKELHRLLGRWLLGIVVVTLLISWATGRLSALVFFVAFVCFAVMILRGMLTGGFGRKKKKS